MYRLQQSERAIQTLYHIDFKHTMEIRHISEIHLDCGFSLHWFGNEKKSLTRFYIHKWFKFGSISLS